MLNYNDDSKDLGLEKEFSEAVRMLKEKQAAKERKMTDTEMKEEITKLKDEVTRLKSEQPKIKLVEKSLENGNVFFTEGLKSPVCYNCSTEKNRPVVLTIESAGSYYKCTDCNARYLYYYQSQKSENE